MRLWSLQEESVVATLLRQGVVRSSVEYTDVDFLQAYAWMRDQMGRRVGPAPVLDASPMWAWAQWRGVRSKMPHLGAKGHFPPGTPAYRLTLEVDPVEVLLSDFSAWHCVLNRTPLHLSPEDDSAFNARFEVEGLSRGMGSLEKMSPALRGELEATWERIFDLTLESDYAFDPPEQRAVQACLWEVQLEQVMGLERFTAR